MPLAERLGVSQEAVGRVEVLRHVTLPEAEALLDQAFAAGPTDPEAAQLLLASAMLAQAQRTPEGRLAAALTLLARLVAKADPQKTLGPDGAVRRAEVMPNGWKYTLGSWDRLRYAWREGMRDLLNVRPVDEGLAQALDEITRLSPAEPEPVRVAIQETFPQPHIAFAVTAVSLMVSGYSLYRETRLERRLRRGKRRGRSRA